MERFRKGSMRANSVEGISANSWVFICLEFGSLIYWSSPIKLMMKKRLRGSGWGRKWRTESPELFLKFNASWRSLKLIFGVAIIFGKLNLFSFAGKCKSTSAKETGIQRFLQSKRRVDFCRLERWFFTQFAMRPWIFHLNYQSLTQPPYRFVFSHLLPSKPRGQPHKKLPSLRSTLIQLPPFWQVFLFFSQ